MDRLINKKGVDRNIRNGYIIAFLLLVFSFGLTQYTNRQLLKQVKWMAHTNNIINSLQIMLTKVVDAETGVRGYIITKDLEYLSPYYAAEGNVDSLETLISDLTKDNPRQKDRIHRLGKSVKRRFDILNIALADFNLNSKVLRDTIKGYYGESKEVMSEIRKTIFMMQWEEKILLTQRTEKLKRTIDSLSIITIISLLVAFTLLIFGFMTYFKESNARKKAVEEIRNFQLELNNRIKQLNDANEELIKMKSQEKFAATGRIARTIAHEVRNPLTNINLAVDQLKGELPAADENSQFLFDMINRNSSRINQLISDLLNSTKFAELSYEKISINTLLDEALAEAIDRIKLHNIKVVKKYSQDICEVSVDKGKIKLAFLNIVINAIEAMENVDKGLLELETKGENNKCHIVIRDNGLGMNKDSLSRLFEPYFTNKPKGNGLGLTNTQNIILNHKGDIKVMSVEGSGTTFTIILDFA